MALKEKESNEEPSAGEKPILVLLALTASSRKSHVAANIGYMMRPTDANKFWGQTLQQEIL